MPVAGLDQFLGSGLGSDGWGRLGMFLIAFPFVSIIASDELQELREAAEIPAVDAVGARQSLSPALTNPNDRTTGRFQQPSLQQVGLGPTNTIVEQPLRAAGDQLLAICYRR